MSPGIGPTSDEFLPPEEVLDIELDEKPSRDFRIIAAHRIGQGSLHEKARDNVAAIPGPLKRKTARPPTRKSLCSLVTSAGVPCPTYSDITYRRTGEARGPVKELPTEGEY
jgi:hypothetical protein